MEIEDVIKNKDDKEFVLKAVQEKGKLLEFASERLQNDKRSSNRSFKTRWRSS